MEQADGDPNTATRARTSSPTRDTHINVHGGNVQIATGDHVSQTVKVHAEVERIASLLDGVVELLGSLDAKDLAELHRLRTEAIEGLRSEPPTASGASRFGERVKDGGFNQ